MDKWADFVISQVVYDSHHLISQAKRHSDSDRGIGEGKIVDRLTIASDIKSGLNYTTIYSGLSSWRRGHKINTFRINGQPYVRIDNNKVPFDNLGDLPEIPSESDDEATPEQLARLEQLEKQISELESKPQQLPSPRGSLPKESTEEIPPEIALAPEPDEDEATPAQITRLTELERQILDFEKILSKAQIDSNSEPHQNTEDEATPEQLARLANIQNQIDELERILHDLKIADSKPGDEQFQINELEEEIEQIEAADIEHEIIQILRRQNQKLDNIENKLRRFTSVDAPIKPPNLEAYCVKCKTKRPVVNPRETIMKNGRPAIKGTCSVCDCNVFRIGKLKISK